MPVTIFPKRPKSRSMTSPTEMASGNVPILGAISLATRISLRLNPQSVTTFTIPRMNTFSELPMVNPPPINDALNVAKTKKAEYDRPATANSSKLPTRRSAHTPIPSTAAR